MTTVAVVGLGAMGSRIAHRFLASDHEVIVWNRSPEKVAELVDRQAVPVDSPAEAARRAEVVITMVADPTALRAVTEAPDGIAAGTSSSVTVIEMSRVGPRAVARLASSLGPGVGMLDAPVLGSVAEAETGSLRIFVGGPASLFERWAPLLSTLGAPLHVGPLGAGAAAKLVANSTLFGVLGILGEALTLARALGLSADVAFQVLAATPLAAQAERRRVSVETNEFPTRFALALARKDADLILDAAQAADVDLRLARAARDRLVDADRGGLGDRDYSAVLAWTLRSGATNEDDL